MIPWGNRAALWRSLSYRKMSPGQRDWSVDLGWRPKLGLPCRAVAWLPGHGCTLCLSKGLATRVQPRVFMAPQAGGSQQLQLFLVPVSQCPRPSPASLPVTCHSPLQAPVLPLPSVLFPAVSFHGALQLTIPFPLSPAPRLPPDFSWMTTSRNTKDFQVKMSNCDSWKLWALGPEREGWRQRLHRAPLSAAARGLLARHWLLTAF